MSLRQDQAIVLRLSEFSETSQIATLLARQCGRVRLIAKGARRSTRTRVATGMDLLERGELTFAPATGDSQLGTLTEWKQLDPYLPLRRGSARLRFALYAAERVTHLTADDDPHPELFDDLAALLADLGTLPRGASLRVRVADFQWQLLAHIGMAPSLQSCIQCGRTRAEGRSAYFSARRGGLLCRNCAPNLADRRLLPASLLDAPRPDEQRGAWFELLDELITHIAERPSLVCCMGRMSATYPAERKRDIAT